MSNWINQNEKCITSNNEGSSLLIKLNDTQEGITIDNNETVDITWIRNGKVIHATTGVFSPEDVKSWSVISEIK